MRDSGFLLLFLAYSAFLFPLLFFTQPQSKFIFYEPTTDHTDYPSGTVATVNYLSDTTKLSHSEIAFILLYIISLIPALIIWKLANGLSGLYYLISGIPYFLLWNGALAQSIIHLLMVLCLLWPPSYIMFAIIGPEIHREWLCGFLLVLVVDFVRRFDGLGKIL